MGAGRRVDHVSGKEMPQKTIQQLDENNKATAVVYNHDIGKLVTRKSKVKRRRREAFLLAFPYRKNKLSPSSTTREPRRKPVSESEVKTSQSKQHLETKTEGTKAHEEATTTEDQQRRQEQTSEGKPQLFCFRFPKQKLQVFVWNPLLRGPKTLCFQLDPGTSISTFKELIHIKIGVKLPHQRLYIRRDRCNFQLIDSLTLNDCGIQQDENIFLHLSTGGLLGGGPKDKDETDDQFLKDLSSKVYEFWEVLAQRLGIVKAEIKQIQTASKDSKQCSQLMLLSWWRKQAKYGEGMNILRGALDKIGFDELSILVPEACQEQETSSKCLAETNRNETEKQDQATTLQPELHENAGIRQKVKKGTLSEEESLAKKQPDGRDRSQPQIEEYPGIKEHSVVKETLTLVGQEQRQEQVYAQGNTHRNEEHAREEILQGVQKEMPSLEEYRHRQRKTARSETPPSEMKQQAPVVESQVPLKRVMPLLENNGVKRSRQEETGETPMDNVQRSRVSIQDEVAVKELLPFDQQMKEIAKPVQETLHSVAQLGTTSPLSALHSHESAPPVSMDNINVHGTNNPIFLAPVHQPTLNFVQNVTVTHSCPVEEGSATSSPQEAVIQCKSELKTQRMTTVTVGRAKSRAQEAAIQCRRELDVRYTTTGSFVQLLPWVDDDMKHIKDMYTKLFLKRDGRSDITVDVEKFEDIFVIKTKEGRVVKRAILCGLAGLGKSTIIDKIAYDWAVGLEILKQFTLLFVLRMSALDQTSDLVEAVFDQLLTHDTTVDKRDLKSFVYSKDTSSRVLILLDGFDEFRTTKRDPNKFGSVLKTLNRKVGQDWFVVVTTRPSHVADLTSKSLVEKPFTRIEVLGFDQEDVKQYVRRFYSEDLDKAEGLLERIRSSSVLSDLAKSPMLLLLMSLLWRDEARLPDTLSKLYNEAMEYIFRRKMPRASKRDIEVVVRGVATAVGKVALEGLISPEQRLSFREGEFDKIVLDKAIQAGILTSQRVIKWLDTHNNVQFIHKTFQECCAARYCQSLVSKDGGKFQQILENIVNPCAFEYMLRFCCGNNEQCTRYVLDALCKKAYEHRHSTAKLALSCYYESQSTNLVSVDFVDQFIKEVMKDINYDNDSLNSLMYFLENVSKHANGGVYLARVRALGFEGVNLSRFSKVFASCLTGMKHLKDLVLFSCALTGDCVNRMLSSVHKANLTLKRLGFPDNRELGGTANIWAPQLRFLRNIEILNLSDCNICTQDMPHIASSVERLSNLTYLDLSCNQALGGQAETWAASLKRMIFLKMLEMKLCGIESNDIGYLAEATCCMVNLMQCVFSTPGRRMGVSSSGSGIHAVIEAYSLAGENMADILQSLAKQRNLVGLHLWGIHGLSGSAALWTPLLLNLTHLEEFELRDDSLQSADIVHIAAALGQMPTVTDISLLGNTPLGGSAKTWAPCLKEMVHVARLNLCGCELRLSDIEPLAAALSQMPALEELSLERNWSLGGQAKMWAPSLHKMVHVVRLNLSRCGLESTDMVHLATAVAQLPTLEELSLEGNRWLRGSAEAWAHSLRQMEHVLMLRVSGCSLTKQDRRHISEVRKSTIDFESEDESDDESDDGNEREFDDGADEEFDDGTDGESDDGADGKDDEESYRQDFFSPDDFLSFETFDRSSDRPINDFD
ncbi:uncharacterized protein LOC110990085 isoform X2 [Acanthaster planci]|uniref:Uncharacterized protein LOC110990085 isoform X2 n=1 Tax=Acanthaster planci TaxID=133434 RepID=A0A8B7ZYU2_ACAPL|nr:uncharacterized protein LOC110990085 isoform X2 [Acanthaster planci]